MAGSEHPGGGANEGPSGPGSDTTAARLARLESRVARLELELETERREAARRRRRESWIRVTLVAVVALVYALYFEFLSGLG